MLFFWYSRGLPDPSRVIRKSGFSTVIMDRDGEERLYDLYVDENRQFTPLSEIPDSLKKATIAIEDKDFYQHSGFDPLGYLRIVKNIIWRRRVIGGSTLTQQLVKNVLLTNERKVSRKIRELLLALRIERQFSKDEILQMYLNEAPYGGTAWGVASAAEMYFDKKVNELSLTESIILAGMPQAPSRYSPYNGDKKAYIGRATDVVRRMREDGFITTTEEKEVMDNLDKVEFKKPGSTIKAAHFVMYVKKQLEEMFGPGVLESGGLEVVTSLDWKLQESAEMIVAEEIAKVEKSLNISNGASIMIDAVSGEILSMVGSRNFFDEDIDGEVNVTTRPRQPGSSIKPLVYASAFTKGYSPAFVLIDALTEFPGKDENTPYIPKNYDNTEHGPIHLREALGSSINIPAVKLLALVGIREVLDLGYRMGIKTLEPTKDNLSRLGLSMALGGGEVKLLELAGAYASFANGGFKISPTAILKVTDRNGKVIYEHKKVKPEKVLDEKVAFLINSVLSDNKARLLTFGENSYLNMGSRAIAVKTGTTDDLRDNWTIGWTRDVVVGVWVGNNDNAKMKNVASGVSGAAPIWRKQMLEALSRTPDRPFEVPAGVVKQKLDKVSGYREHDGLLAYEEWVIEGSVSDSSDPMHKMIKVCKGQADRLANPIQIARNDYDLKEVIELKEKDPLTNKDLWQKGIDSWIAKQTDERYKIPRETCLEASGVHIEVKSPADKSKIDDEKVLISFEVASGRSIEWVDIFVDGAFEERVNQASYQKELKFSKGQHNLRIKARNSAGEEAEKTVKFGVKEELLDPEASGSAQPG
ncbi:transglycosylase domain-containing protein [Candidatus Collierbacteria bacterium]|nr:transglycosylase domain-containing protein [Candidatus Collierbacteria bacterium]